MLRIGDFSRLARVSIRTLQYYDDIGLFSPDFIQQENGYRYYRLHQLTRLNRILALKAVGFSLSEIHSILQGEPSTEAFQTLLSTKRVELIERITRDQNLLKHLEFRMQLLNWVPATHDVVLKQVPSCRVVSLRAQIENPTETGFACEPLLETLHKLIHAHQLVTTTPEMMFFHMSAYQEDHLDVEVAIGIEGRPAEVPGAQVYTLPAATVASLTFQGAYEELQDAGKNLFYWIALHEYQSAGAAREIHHSGSLLQTGRLQQVVIELQVPVQPRPPLEPHAR